MELQTIETVTLTLLFAVPGVVFLMAYMRVQPTIEGIDDIREYLPAELVAFYITASAIIHSVLLPIFLLLSNVLAWCLGEPHLLLHVTEPLADVTSADIQSLTISVLAVFVYFGASLVLAYLFGRWWGTKYAPPLPGWLEELISIRAACYTEPLWLRLLLCDGAIVDGLFDTFQWNRREDTFDVVCRFSPKDEVIWVSSSNIAEMTVRCGKHIRKFILNQQREAKRPHSPENRDSIREDLNQVWVLRQTELQEVHTLNKWFAGLIFAGLLGIAASNLYRELSRD